MIAAVIDTNVWVSAFLNPAGFPARLIRAGKTGDFLIVSSLPLLDELREVLLRPRLMKIRQATVQDVNATRDLDLIEQLRQRGIETATVQRFINFLEADVEEAEPDV